MKLAARFCRLCGSKILVRNVCHNCSSNPLKGNNYCYDCGALTPLGSKCEKCGANFKNKSTPKLVAIVTSIFFIAIATFIIIYYNSNTSNDKSNPTSQLKEKKMVDAPVKNVERISTAINNSAKVDTVKMDVAKTDSIKSDTSKLLLPLQQINTFTQQELGNHKISCSYFKKNQRGAVYFFNTNATGYLKINGNIVVLKRSKKGSDISVYSGEKYQAQLIIDGLSGNERAWLAAVSLIVKDSAHKIIIRQKVYSTCIEF